MQTIIDFYFDFSSTYSYVALPRLVRLADEHDCKIDWKPIALGFIFKTNNHAPPAAETAKGRYVWHDVERSASLEGLPFKWPKPFPFNSMTAARIFWHLADSDSDRAIEWAKAVFHASFGEGRDCSNPDELVAVAGNMGLDGHALMESTGHDAVKAKLKEITGEAMGRGVFGAPTFFVGDEMFWGSDRLGQLEGYISGD